MLTRLKGEQDSFSYWILCLIGSCPACIQASQVASCGGGALRRWGSDGEMWHQIWRLHIKSNLTGGHTQVSQALIELLDASWWGRKPATQDLTNHCLQWNVDICIDMRQTLSEWMVEELIFLLAFVISDILFSHSFPHLGRMLSKCLGWRPSLVSWAIATTPSCSLDLLRLWALDCDQDATVNWHFGKQLWPPHFFGSICLLKNQELISY